MLTLYDIHSHILPSVDDGSNGLEMSFCMLRECIEQSVGFIAATPHYYSDKPINDFLKSRNEAYFELQEMIEDYSDWHREKGKEEIAFPKIVLGAEVALSPIIANLSNLRDLCINHTNYLLLEMPFRQWTLSDLKIVEQIIQYHGIIPIIAHIERFTRFTSADSINDLLDFPVNIQLNAELIISNFHKAKQFLLSDKECFLGSDCHNMTSRPPNLRDAADILERKNMSSDLKNVLLSSKKLFN